MTAGGSQKRWTEAQASPQRGSMQTASASMNILQVGKQEADGPGGAISKTTRDPR